MSGREIADSGVHHISDSQREIRGVPDGAGIEARRGEEEKEGRKEGRKEEGK